MAGAALPERDARGHRGPACARPAHAGRPAPSRPAAAATADAAPAAAVRAHRARARRGEHPAGHPHACRRHLRPARGFAVISPGDACRNCGAAAPGNYCPQCGQETNLALPSAIGFLREAAGRYVALDGRMWRTLAGLLVRPGFRTRECCAGRRRRRVRPARLFITLSLALFAVIGYTSHAPMLVSPGAAASGDAAAIAQADHEMDGVGIRIKPDLDLNVD